jgi:IgA Peptidase M64
MPSALLAASPLLSALPTRGTDPKLTIAIMGDGYTESDIGVYHNRVDDQVLGALRLDQLATHQGALRIIRIDVVSVESGVRERRYNADGTIKSDVFKFSRLGVIPNDDWNRCWFDHSDFTDARIEKLRRSFAADADHVVVLVKSSTWGGCSSVGPGVGLFTEGSGRVTVAHEMGHNLFFLDDETSPLAESRCRFGATRGIVAPFQRQMIDQCPPNSTELELHASPP